MAVVAADCRIFLLGWPSLIGVKFVAACHAEAAIPPRELMKQMETCIIVDFTLSSFTGTLSNASLGAFICCHIGRRKRRGRTITQR